MQEAFLPSMPDDMQAVAQEALGHLQWYRESTTENKSIFMFKLCPSLHYIYLLDVFISQIVKTVTPLPLERYD